nr:iron-sulfur cluster assembly scaffold protein [Salarchaeum japonicum]
MAEYYHNPTNPDGIENPTFRKHSAETSCGDEGEFHVRIDESGRIEAMGFRSDSCAVSQAVASLLADHLTGAHVRDLTDLSGTVDALLDGDFPDMRRDCVVGPEDVLQAGAREHLTDP